MKAWLIIAVIHNLSICEITPEKNSGLNGIQNHDLCDTGAVLYQLNYQANWELVTLWVRKMYIFFLAYFFRGFRDGNEKFAKIRASPLDFALGATPRALVLQGEPARRLWSLNIIFTLSCYCKIVVCRYVDSLVCRLHIMLRSEYLRSLSVRSCHLTVSPLLITSF